MTKDWIVIVRTQGRNNELELNNALESLINQTYKDLAVILTIHSNKKKVITNTLRFIEKFEKKLLIYPIAVRENQGNRSFPLNIALEKAKYLKAKYISFLDYDDIYYPNMGSELIPNLKNKGFVFAYGLSTRAQQEILKDKNGRNYIKEIRKDTFDSRDFNKASFLLDNYIPFNSFILKAEYIKNEKFDERLTFLEDWDFLRRLIIRKDFSVIQIKKPVSEYRVTNDESDSHSLKTEEEWKKSREISDTNIQNQSTEIKIGEMLEIRERYQEKIERLIKIESNSLFKIARSMRNYFISLFPKSK